MVLLHNAGVTEVMIQMIVTVDDKKLAGEAVRVLKKMVPDEFVQLEFYKVLEQKDEQFKIYCAEQI